MPHSNPNVEQITYHDDNTMTVKLKNDTTMNIKYKSADSSFQKEDNAFDWIVYRE